MLNVYRRQNAEDKEAAERQAKNKLVLFKSSVSNELSPELGYQNDQTLLSSQLLGPLSLFTGNETSTGINQSNMNNFNNLNSSYSPLKKLMMMDKTMKLEQQKFKDEQN